MFAQLRQSEFGRAMGFMRHRLWLYLIAVSTMTLTAGGMAIVESYAFKYAVNAAVEQERALWWTALTIFIVGMAIVTILIPLCRYLYQRCAHVTATEIRLQVFEHILHLPVARLEEQHSGDLVARLTTDTNTMIGIYTHKLRRFIAPFSYSIGAGVAMFLLDWRIATGLLLFNLGAAYLNVRFVQPIRRISDLLQTYQSTLTERLIDLLAGFPVMKMYHIEQLLLGSYTKTNQAIATQSIQRRHIQGILDSTNYQ